MHELNVLIGIKFYMLQKPDNLVKRMVKTLRKSPSEERHDDWVNIINNDLNADIFCLLFFILFTHVKCMVEFYVSYFEVEMYSFFIPV